MKKPKLASQPSMKSSGFSTNKLFARLSLKEQILFTKRLSFLIRAGVPILESLRMLARYRSKSKNWIFSEIIKSVESGQYLSASMTRFRHIFGDFVIHIIRAGESVGILDQNLSYLSEELKKQYELRRKIVSAMVYPLFIIIATIGIVILLLAFVFPKVLPVFSSLNMELPLTTRLLIVTSDFAIKYGIYVGLAIVGLVVAFWILIKKNRRVKLFTDRVIMFLPVIGQLVQNYQLTNFCRTFGLLLKSGLAVSESVTILAETTPNLIYKNELYKVAKAVSRGKKISQQMEKNPRYFPEILVQMIAIGELSGNLSETFLYLAEMYEGEVDELTKNLSNSLEPILMVSMGVIVGFMAVSIITPIYEITKNLSPR